MNGRPGALIDVRPAEASELPLMSSWECAYAPEGLSPRYERQTGTSLADEALPSATAGPAPFMIGLAGRPLRGTCPGTDPDSGPAGTSWKTGPRHDRRQD